VLVTVVLALVLLRPQSQPELARVPEVEPA
jgi:hypothetical protein